MARLLRLLPPAALAVFGLLGSAAPAAAGWLTITNDTRRVVLIQETGGPLNRPIRGKCVKLQPGETYREYHRLPGEKTVLLLDANAAAPPAASGRLRWYADDAPFAVKDDGLLFKLTPGGKAKK